MMESCLDILYDSLLKKLDILEEIEDKSLEQSELIKNQNVNLDLVDFNMDEKAKLIEDIIALDHGFESMYEKIRPQIVENKELYKERIKKIQFLIEKVTEKSAAIQVIEARNKAQMDIVFATQKKEVQTRKNAMSVARDYYQNMNKVKHVSPQFLDHKK